MGARASGDRIVCLALTLHGGMELARAGIPGPQGNQG